MINRVVMTLNSNTKVGLTFGQIITIIAMTSFFVMGYRDLDLRISLLEKKTVETDRMIQLSNIEIEKVRIENRQDHNAMDLKIDQILLNIKGMK